MKFVKNIFARMFDISITASKADIAGTQNGGTSDSYNHYCYA